MVFQSLIVRSREPVSMLSRFGAKTLLMHICFLTLRVCAWPLLEIGLGFCNLAGFVVACVALFYGFNFRLSSLRAHWDVFGLWLLAAAGAFVTEALDFRRQVSL